MYYFGWPVSNYCVQSYMVSWLLGVVEVLWLLIHNMCACTVHMYVYTITNMHTVHMYCSSV